MEFGLDDRVFGLLEAVEEFALDQHAALEGRLIHLMQEQAVPALLDRLLACGQGQQRRFVRPKSNWSVGPSPNRLHFG